MILSDSSIQKRLTSGSLVVKPLFLGAIQPASIDLRLGSLIKIANPDGWVDLDLEQTGKYRLKPLDFVLGATLEWIEIPNDLVGILVGKSSRAREGIQVEAAGYVDPGWHGNLTLEIAHLSPLPAVLFSGMPICQLRLERIDGKVEHPYNGHYQNSLGPVSSRTVGARVP
jgi:dCTP deaminase